MPDQPRHPRVGDDARREDGIRGREQRPDQERLGPVQVGQQLGRAGHQRSGDRHGEHQLPQRHVPGGLQHLGVDLEAVAEEDHDQGGEREHAHEARARIEGDEIQGSRADREPSYDEQGRERQEAAPREPGDQGADDEHDAQHRRDAVEVADCGQGRGHG